MNFGSMQTFGPSCCSITSISLSIYLHRNASTYPYDQRLPYNYISFPKQLLAQSFPFIFENLYPFIVSIKSWVSSHKSWSYIIDNHSFVKICLEFNVPSLSSPSFTYVSTQEEYFNYRVYLALQLIYVAPRKNLPWYPVVLT